MIEKTLSCFKNASLSSEKHVLGPKKVGGSESEDRSYLCAMVAFSKLSVMVAAPAAANQLFVAPAPYAAAPQARRQRTLSSPMCSIYCCGTVFYFFSRQRE